tara:strand:- start:8622 stop:10904 length:2283 start_codon:yes stop_codon:yes gene_type:complete
MFDDIQQLLKYGRIMTKFNLLCYEALIHFANIDENFDKSEKEIILEFAERHNIKKNYNNIAIPKNEKKSRAAFEKSVVKITKLDISKNYALYTLLHCLYELADADDLVEEQEKELLKFIKNKISPAVAADLILDEKQKEIINMDASDKVVVQALPGTGKTDVIARRVKKLYEIDRIRSNEILLISFSRNAVLEMKKRIAKIMGDKKYPVGIKILTLDKLATSANFAMNPNHSLMGYDHNMKKFLELILDEEKNDWRDSHREIRHIFIDEAQDLVGSNRSPRRVICEQLIKLASKRCGITICGDANQQIYPWGRRLKEDEKISLLSVIAKDKKFKKRELTKIYRSKKTSQIKFVEDVALQIMLMDNEEIEEIKNPLKKLAKKSKGTDPLDAVDNYLLLYRWRKDLVNSSWNLQELDKSFRLSTREGSNSSYYENWVYSFFKYFKDQDLDQVTKKEFKNFFKSLSARHNLEKNPDQIWRLIYSYASSGSNEISIDLFKERLRDSSKMINDFTSKDFGFRGPKLSTIHAAKGSQEQNVSIHEFDQVEKDLITDKYDAKLLFVALSRAKESIEVAESQYSAKNWLNFDQRRWHSFTKITPTDKKATAFIEIGNDGDYDPLSIVANKLTLKEAERTQEILRNLYIGNKNYQIFAKRNGKKLPFSIFLKENKSNQAFQLGKFTEDFSADLNRISQKTTFIPKKLQEKYLAPNLITDLKLLDIATYIPSNKKDGDIDELPILNKFKELGCWLYPVIYNLHRFEFKKK